MLRKFSYIIIVLIVTLLYGCSDEEEVVNPEDSLDEYIEAWQTFQFHNMTAPLTEDSLQLIQSQEWELHERMENVYGQLGIDDIVVTYESRNFEEEEINLEEIEELTYPIEVTMNTIAGTLRYHTDVTLVKKIELMDEEEVEHWLVTWHPTHFFIGMQEPTDRISISTSQPKRGEIYDRHGIGLVMNGEVNEVGFVPDFIEDFDSETEALAEALNLDLERVKNAANQYPNNPDWFARVVEIPLDDTRVNGLADSIPGVQVRQSNGRVYNLGAELYQLVGYVGPITGEELEEREGMGYSSSSILGKAGLELVLEDELRGSQGVTISVEDENRQLRDVIIKTEPENGKNFTLTIDRDIQSLLAETLGDDVGSAVAMNPTTGEVLALVSNPAYDSNTRSLGVRDPLADVYEHEDLHERRWQIPYSTGSIFKPFTAAIGIEEGTLDPEKVETITGKRWQPENSDWGNYQVTRVNEHINEVNLNTAMKFSDNIYFARQSLNIGANAMEEWADKLGFGEPMPFAFPMNASTIANESIESEILLADTGYGQGQVQLNALHVSALYTMFIHEGNIIQPILFDDEEKGAYWIEEIISPNTADAVLDSIISVVEDSNGTAFRPQADHGRSIAGKTGTAELKTSQEDEDGPQLGWYVAMDYEKKDILVTMMVDDKEGTLGSGYVVDKVNEFLSRLD
ncbi:peptidoglycan D,D-transpeptidase FtsI family protein [Evansella cellulosilytica]|uniref:serine-type D-Ala-D-Ala carboxypeptidase n=1 Tax=Evansella cellulosilytica (strain ATCC 21833 / DSM 2522 / FERM P-1141 / JCM 9156 / N-4) TaxID=649639 RepID=E6TSC7_EVAC2|nr:penicillin-binding protein 2 [Evansella cellulosilytica]ADU31896.1 penicillin-binding protein transpeptidase [Evansella cellulosilytica DSM 2522]